MSLTAVLREMIGVFDELGLTDAVTGGMAVRVYGIPRPTHDVDFTVAVADDRRAELFAAVTRRVLKCRSRIYTVGLIASPKCRSSS